MAQNDRPKLTRDDAIDFAVKVVLAQQESALASGITVITPFSAALSETYLKKQVQKLALVREFIKVMGKEIPKCQKPD